MIPWNVSYQPRQPCVHCGMMGHDQLNKAGIRWIHGGFSWDFMGFFVKFHGANPFLMCYIAIEHGHWNHV